MALYTRAGTGSSERARITKEGNTGIDTNAPSYKLDVTGTTRSSSLRVMGTTIDDGVTYTLLSTSVTGPGIAASTKILANAHQRVHRSEFGCYHDNTSP
jgi:hypothetical protein